MGREAGPAPSLQGFLCAIHFCPMGGLGPLEIEVSDLCHVELSGRTFSANDSGSVSIHVKTWDCVLAKLLNSSQVGSPGLFFGEFGFLLFPLPPLSLPTLCFELLPSAWGEPCRGKPVKCLNVEPASQTFCGSEW